LGVTIRQGVNVTAVRRTGDRVTGVETSNSFVASYLR
jgi:glycine/D-amino acid oxidase-like deaminating enzyme